MRKGERLEASKIDLLGEKVIKEIEKLIDKGHKGTTIFKQIEKNFKNELKEIPSVPTIDRYIKLYLAKKASKVGTKVSSLAVIKEQQKAIQGEIVRSGKLLNLTDVAGIMDYSAKEVQATVEWMKKCRENNTASWQDMGILLQGCRQLKEIAESLAESADKFQSKDTTMDEKVRERTDWIFLSMFDALRATVDEATVKAFQARFEELMRLHSGE